MLAACGGGGGGSGSLPNGPGGNGGGGPSPSSSPHSTPGTTPTPRTTPTPVVTPTPLVTPTPMPTTGPGSTILPDSTGRFDPVQILDLKMTPSQIASEAPFEDAVWGAFDPSAWVNAHRGMIVSRYFMPFNDDSSISQHDLTWWQQNHPDWIMYACDQNGNPTQYVARDDGFPDVPLDIHNPAVIQYQMQMVIPYMVANGYNALAADNITFHNYLGGPNVLLGQNDPGENYGSDGWYGCGIWEGNTFVRRYSGGPGAPDPNFIADLVNWVETVHSTLTQNPQYSQYHLRLLANHPMGTTNNQNDQAVLANVDLEAYEASFTNFDRFGANFPEIIQWMQWIQAAHVAYVDVNYFCKNDGGPCEQQLTSSQKEFAMAAYELGNEGGAGFFMSPAGGQSYSYYTELQTQLGKPCAEYTTPGTDMYARKFANGLVVVNNSSSTEQYTLPNSDKYVDIENRTVTNPLPVNSDDGYVLTTSGNGCL